MLQQILALPSLKQYICVINQIKLLITQYNYMSTYLYRWSREETVNLGIVISSVPWSVDTAKRNEKDCKHVEGTMGHVCGLVQMLSVSQAHVAMLQHPCIASAIDDVIDSLEEVWSSSPCARRIRAAADGTDGWRGWGACAPPIAANTP